MKARKTFTHTYFDEQGGLGPKQLFIIPYTDYTMLWLLPWVLFLGVTSNLRCPLFPGCEWIWASQSSHNMSGWWLFWSWQSLWWQTCKNKNIITINLLCKYNSYRPRSEGDNVLGNVRPSVGPPVPLSTVRPFTAEEQRRVIISPWCLSVCRIVVWMRSVSF